MSFWIHSFIEVFKGLPYTLLITCGAFLLSIILGTMTALFQIKRIPVLHQLTTVYNSFMRSTPLIVQLFVFYYGTPAFIMWLNQVFKTSLNPDSVHPLTIAFIAFSLHATAYLSETIKSGFYAVDNAQVEAGLTVGLSQRDLYRRIIIPQAFMYALPNIENQFIMLLKGTSLAFAIQIPEIIANSHLVANEGYRFIEVYSIAALLYWAIAIIIEAIFKKVALTKGRFLYAN
ncbi:amino acid ABC transporter permease [Staphylococcus massiliensis]|uniref:amino acid ABC transporter permease n=1 Tax=Staphylococcus massiliensis TaxID=555791 RepID=UPI001EE064A2|nr:amino acid ABC transporter permease [Staphylococcus massiliensis]MCG3411543.1 amino acid ABC transporter permease [Staphylococcus massiliensis]